MRGPFPQPSTTEPIRCAGTTAPSATTASKALHSLAMIGSGLLFTDDHAAPALRAAARAAGMDSAHLLDIARQQRAEAFAAWIASLFATHQKGENDGYAKTTARLGHHNPNLAGGGGR